MLVIFKIVVIYHDCPQAHFGITNLVSEMTNFRAKTLYKFTLDFLISTESPCIGRYLRRGGGNG